MTCVHGIVRDGNCLGLLSQPASGDFLTGSASIGEMENLLSRWTEVIRLLNRVAVNAGKPEFKAPERFVTQVRKFMQRAAPSCREVAYLQGFLTLVRNVTTILTTNSEQTTATETEVISEENTL